MKFRAFLALNLLIVFGPAVLNAAAISHDDKSSDSASKAEPAPVDPLVSAQGLFKDGKYDEAAAAFRVVIEKNPALADARAGLVRSLLRTHKIDEAEDAARKAAVALPSVALVHASLGDAEFRAGKLGEAESEYRAALKLDGNSARGWFGMARMYETVSMLKHRDSALALAHGLDPNDEQIFDDWLDSLPRSQQLDELKKHAGANPSAEDADRIKYLTETTRKKPWELASELKPTEVKLVPYGIETAEVVDIDRSGPGTISQGFGLQVKFNDRASSTLLLDTGAEGITIGRKLAEKAGVVKIVDSFFGGIGDRGLVKSYLGWVDKIDIGGVEFRNCIVEVSSKKDVADGAGLIGADVFRRFLITLDFRNFKMALAPLPKNPESAGSDDSEAAQDRYIASEMQGYTRFFRFGHDMVVSVVANDKAAGNFILDTGSEINSISERFAAKVTKASYQGDYQISGLSGKVENVLTGDKVILQFAKMRIESHDLPVFSTESISSWEGTEIAGLIGIRTLVQTKMTIDYRDGLVNLEVYDFKKARK